MNVTAAGTAPVAVRDARRPAGRADKAYAVATHAPPQPHST
ncbi:hypothetical protein [Streptomyces fagopyri]